VISEMHRGKAAGRDGLTAEHCFFCHSLLPCILAKLFNLFISYGHVPVEFGDSYRSLYWKVQPVVTAKT